MTDKETEEAIKIIKDFTSLINDESGKSDIKMLEIRSLKSSIELSEKTLISLKNQFWYNLMYVLIGGAIGLCTTMAVQYNEGEEIERLHKSAYELNDKHDSLNIGLHEMRLEIISLKTELDSLKNK
ncbi:hypothetical protein [Confluentibacter flavum]|uniref:Uncharacterized protein n=1 Tax=Confluentibacter flavum TaxID=1909700 RepID=A0A2N3HNV5_9FLAO|nr:hypothetical protein [Confluentibacter flavum]PKQ46659.1 hypothetical protein CSW08_01750 [Confluentibacter flavum]